jgi:hypothetical protein
MLQVHCSTIHSSELSDILSKQLVVVGVPILYNHVVAAARLASVALIGLSTEVSGLHLIYGKQQRWRAGSGRNERMVKRQEEKRRKRFANRVWACRFLLEERQA